MMTKRILISLIILNYFYSFSQENRKFSKIIEMPTVKEFIKAYHYEFHFNLMKELNEKKIRLYKDSTFKKPKNTDSLWYITFFNNYNVKNRKNDTFINSIDEFAIDSYIVNKNYVTIKLNGWCNHQVFGYLKRSDFEKYGNKYFFYNWYKNNNEVFVFNEKLYSEFMDSIIGVIVNKMVLSNSSNFKFKDYNNDSNIIINYYSQPSGFYYDYYKTSLTNGKTNVILKAIALDGILTTGRTIISARIEIKNLRTHFTKNEIELISKLFFTSI